MDLKSVDHAEKGTPAATISNDDRSTLQKLFTFIPNDYMETPRLVKDGEYAVHESKVGRKWSRLEVVGKFCTALKYFSIVTCITVLISITLFKGSDISYSETDKAKLTYNFTVTLLRDPEVQNLKCPTSKNDLTLGDFTTFNFEISDVCSMISEDLAKTKFFTYNEIQDVTKGEYNQSTDYLDDYGSDYGIDNWMNYSSSYNDSSPSYNSTSDYGGGKCAAHAACDPGEYCDGYSNCYDCAYYEQYNPSGVLNDVYDKLTPGCTNLSPPPPPSPPPSPSLNGRCQDHRDCTASTHYCDSSKNCWSCNSYYFYGGVADTYDGYTSACSAFSAPPPPPAPSSCDSWWCFWSNSPSEETASGGDVSNSDSALLRKQKHSLTSLTEANSSLPSSSSSSSFPTNKTEASKSLLGRKRSPLAETNGNDANEKLYRNQKAKIQDTLGKYSFCRSNDEGRSTSICTMVLKNCKYSTKLVAEAKIRLERTLLPFSALADDELLQLTVNAHTENVVQTMISGLTSPESIIQQWSSANMPRITGFLNVLFNAVKGLRFRNQITSQTNFTNHVVNECTSNSRNLFRDDPCNHTRIADGICDKSCNIAECLYDGGDCISLELSKNPNEILNDNSVFGSKYKYRGLSQIAWENPEFGKRSSFLLRINQSLDALPNEFKSFDEEDTCGNPETWYDVKNVVFTDGEAANNKIEDIISRLNNQEIFLNANIPVPQKPAVAFPLKKKMHYSCDQFKHILGPSPYADNLSLEDMNEWTEWAEKIIEFALDPRLPVEFFDAKFGNFLEDFEKDILYPLKYAKVVKMATINSGSFYDLNLDASLHKNGDVYNVSAPVNFKLYFENSGLESCTYTKKFKIEPSAVVAVVIGIIGGVTSGCTFLTKILYLILKTFTVGSARQ